MVENPSSRFVLPAEPIVPTGSPAQASQQISVDQALTLASQLQSQGRLQESEYFLRQILQTQPNHAFALHLLGVLAHQCGQPELAIDLIRKAVQNNNQVALFHANLGEMNRQLGNLDEAVVHGERAVALDPGMAMAHGNLGIAYFDREDYTQAEACQLRALAIDPNFAPALNNMGSVRRAHKQMDEAMDWYRRAIAADPRYLEPLSNLGAVLLEEDRAGEAIEPLNRALQINPQYAGALCNLGLARSALEQHDIALDWLGKALQVRPAYAEAHIGLARVLQAYEEKQNLPEAEKSALRAIEFASNQGNRKVLADAYHTLGSIYGELARSSEAEAAYRRALEINPESDEALLGLGHLCLENGETEKAEALFHQALVLKDDNVGARFHLAQIRKVRAEDENFAALMAAETAARNSATPLSDKKAISLHFALGKCYDDSGDFDKAFPHFLEGCRLKRASFQYDPEQESRIFDSIKQIFNQATIERLRGGGDASSVPIFVLGMPRSGTTLTEQILASHPDVYGAGELPDLLAIAQRGVAGTGAAFPENLRVLDQEQLALWGAEYVAGLQQRAPDARHITDKMPVNFLAIGLIHLMLPNAKIIHVNRNPVDTCFSCFTRLFNRKQHQTYDLAELGQYYVGYVRLMDHWRSVLPAGTFLNVNYEGIVADQATQSRRLIEYCGLEWNEACLDFHKNKRAIRTASVTQVRQPMYQSSVARWRHYEKSLGPLLDALGDLVPKST